MIINSGNHSPRYFYTIFLIKSSPNAFYSSYRMSQPPQLTISGCYDELLADLFFLLQSFSENESVSIHELPHLGNLHFCIVLVELFPWLVSLELWGQAGVKFITRSGRKTTCEEIAPMAILVTNGIGEGSLGMATIFLPLWPGKSGAFSCTFNLIPMGLTLSRCSGSEDLHQLSLCPMRVFWLPLPRGNHPFSRHFNHSISPTQMCLCRLLWYSSTQVILPWEKEGNRLKAIPFLKEALQEGSGEDHCLSPLYQCQSPPPPSTFIEMWAHRLRRQSASTQPWGSWKWLPRPGLSLCKSWPGIGRTSGPRWLSRWTPHSWRSSPKWVKPIWWGFFLGFPSPLPFKVQVPYVLWVKHSLLSHNPGQMPQQMTPHQDLRALQPQHPWAVQHNELVLCLLQLSLCQTSWLPAPPLGS